MSKRYSERNLKPGMTVEWVNYLTGKTEAGTINCILSAQVSVDWGDYGKLVMFYEITNAY